jgi:preprotein translocase subunit SecF
MKRVIGFTKIRKITYLASSAVIVALFLVTFLVNGGFTLGIDFEPGVAIQVAVDKSVSAPIGDVRKALEEMPHVQVQNFGGADSQEYNVRIRAYEETQGYADKVTADIKAKLIAKFGDGKVKAGAGDNLSSTVVGPRFSSSLTQQAFLLVGLSLVLIGIYIWIRFRLGFAVGAVASTIHNVLFLVGFIGATKMAVTSNTIAAVLTIVGYCLNDTIVVFDRIRENEKLMADQKLGFVFDSSISQILSRTIVVAFAVLLADVSIFVFTSGEIKDFAAVLLVGVIVGTYSSIFIASPTLLDWRTAEIKRKKKREAKLGGKPMEAVEATMDGEEVAAHGDQGEIDAEAVADELRRQRQEKKKF